MSFFEQASIPVDPPQHKQPKCGIYWYTCCTIQHRTNVCFAAIFALCFSAFPAVYAQGFSVFLSR
ncbi:hypothetical protein [Allofournierella massiliensis]|uniref:hypothetical protein n=1 Tax=Allofournierella massiliensis TaxID=1650663 RepID=UPI00356666A8